MYQLKERIKRLLDRGNRIRGRGRQIEIFVERKKNGIHTA
jgi:hypothetical protein